MTRVGNSQAIARGRTGGTGTRGAVEYVVERVDVVERRRRGGAKTLWKGSVDSRTKPTTTRVERKHKRRINETTRTLGTHRKTL